jgi:hypothetical protein
MANTFKTGDVVRCRLGCEPDLVKDEIYTIHRAEAEYVSIKEGRGAGWDHERFVLARKTTVAVKILLVDNVEEACVFYQDFTPNNGAVDIVEVLKATIETIENSRKTNGYLRIKKENT